MKFLKEVRRYIADWEGPVDDAEARQKLSRLNKRLSKALFADLRDLGYLDYPRPGSNRLHRIVKSKNDSV